MSGETGAKPASDISGFVATEPLKLIEFAEEPSYVAAARGTVRSELLHRKHQSKMKHQIEPRGLSNAIEYILLEEELLRFSEGEVFVFIANPGNWGDGLIRYATERFFRQRNLPYKTLCLDQAMEMSREDIEEFSGNKNVRAVYSGGGVFFPKYRMHKKLPKLINMTDAMFVLPHSFSVPAKKLGFRRNDVIFRRDLHHSVEFAPNSSFCHDMALSLPNITVASASEEVGYFYRTDKESAAIIAPPQGNRDISKEGTDKSSIAGFFDGISRYATVHTDRLHVSIAAALMGRDVHLYPNSYFKNQSIYESSLKDAFPNMTFHPDHPAAKA